MPRAELGRVHNKKNFTGLVPLFDPVHASHDRAGKHVYDRASGFGRACSFDRHITTGAAHVVVNPEASCPCAAASSNAIVIVMIVFICRL